MTFQIFLNFLYLGCISFGGPAAHIGYFRRVFVEQKAWLSEQDFAAHLALSQFLPGPASSQLGFAIGSQRGGIPGGIAAFLGFTLPSFMLMLGLAVWQRELDHDSWAYGIITGLKLLAVVVVADAIWSMAKQFCLQPTTIFISLGSALTLALAMSPLHQFALLLGAALWMAWRATPTRLERVKLNRLAWICVISFFGLLALSFVAPISLFGIFYQAGSFVFGGGHVVLPLLESFIGEGLSNDRFLLGYAAAQAVPGPMFSFASYLGAVLRPDIAAGGAVLATFAVFLPGFLLLTAVSGVWRQIALHGRIVAAIAGVNAVAVGMLAAAWVNPVLINAPQDLMSLSLAAGGLLLLRSRKVPIIWLIALFSVYGAMRFVDYFPAGLLGG
ncbi:chromate efflux transporter [Zhongshania borealis]|uniref:Chromate efflux transporter n=1 Tax=Zhongshania borealis TaxID=889488 RepID=A0ABP7WXG2_9GAMM